MELLQRLEEDLKNLKEMQGEQGFPEFLYDQIENEIFLKRKKIQKMQKNSFSCRKYNQSEKGRERQKKRNEKRKQQRLEEKLKAEIDPEFKKLLDEKNV